MRAHAVLRRDQYFETHGLRRLKILIESAAHGAGSALGGSQNFALWTTSRFARRRTADAMAMVRQPQLFDLDERYRKLSKVGKKALKINARSSRFP
jgi:hypothetical protein